MDVLKSYARRLRWACSYRISGPWRCRFRSRPERQPASATSAIHSAATPPRANPDRIIISRPFVELQLESSVRDYGDLRSGHPDVQVLPLLIADGLPLGEDAPPQRRRSIANLAASTPT